MATKWSWITLVVVIICAIHFNSLEVDACCKKDDDCCSCSGSQYDCYDTGRKCKKRKYDDDCCGYRDSGCSCKKKYKQMKKRKTCCDDYDYYDDCCDCCCCDCDKKKGKKEGMKEKIMKKIMEKKEKKEKKKRMKKRKKMCKARCDDDCYYDDYCGYDDYYGCDKVTDSCQKVIVENGPAIIQTIIVDKELYAKYGCGCVGASPLQKVVVKDEDSCYCPPVTTCATCPCSSPCDDDCCCDTSPCVRVVAKDPYCRSTGGYYPSYPGYCY